MARAPTVAATVRGRRWEFAIVLQKMALQVVSASFVGYRKCDCGYDQGTQADIYRLSAVIKSSRSSSSAFRAIHQIHLASSYVATVASHRSIQGRAGGLDQRSHPHHCGIYELVHRRYVRSCVISSSKDATTAAISYWRSHFAFDEKRSCSCPSFGNPHRIMLCQHRPFLQPRHEGESSEHLQRTGVQPACRPR